MDNSEETPEGSEPKSIEADSSSSHDLSNDTLAAEAQARYAERKSDKNGEKDNDWLERFQARVRIVRPKPSWPSKVWVSPARRIFEGNEVRYLTFDPLSTSQRTARINPLDGIRVGTIYEVRDAERIAEALLGLDEYPSTNANQVHFSEHGARVLAALILHVLYTPETERTLSGVLSAVTDEMFYELNTLIDYICNAKHDLDAKMGWTDASGNQTFTHPAIRQRLRSARSMSDGESSGIYTTVTRGLAIFADPLVAQNTAATDFDFEDLFDGIVLALRVPPRGERLAPVYRAISSILSDRLDERVRFGPLRYPPFLSMQPMPAFRI
jgi:type IV secretory pathway TraG/TraD family ATPase VirD4